MTRRSEPLQSFIDTARAAFGELASDPRSRQAVELVFSALQVPAAQRPASGSRLPVCSNLTRALAVQTSDTTLRDLLERFDAIEPLLEWRQRTANDGSASANFAEGHANATIVGPGGLEDRQDVWLGASLLAPNVRYPDHDHPPEEVYLVLSPGEFQQAEGPWFAPGIGGSFYNTPNIKHAMRSHEEPLLAFWVLRPGSSE